MAQKSGAFEVKLTADSAVEAKDHSEKDNKNEKTERYSIHILYLKCEKRRKWKVEGGIGK